MRKAVVCCTIRIRWISKSEVEEHTKRLGFVPVSCYLHCEAFNKLPPLATLLASIDSDLFDDLLYEAGEIGAIIVDQRLSDSESVRRSFCGRCIERIFVVEPT